ncbi:hypothetical protein [Haloferula sp. BvORR071]|uniref:hypothetical protein n=1 Tax=Haloferula sp. BvORR071 TaxID=1396141 RepID=UPI000554651A|nr:hypothetical protein [Haloferula sp. BvORR071]
MKKAPLLATLAAAGLSLLPSAFADDGQVLAVKGKRFDLPAGTKITRETTTDLKEAKLTATLPNGQSMDGTMSRKDIVTDTTEILSPSKLRKITGLIDTTGKMVMSGKDQAIPPAPSPLADKAVILEEKDGTWTATLEQGTPNDAMTAFLKTMADSFTKDEDLSRYGDTPRKPGDKWPVDLKQLESLAGAAKPEGSCTMEFVKVEDYAGTPCALLKMSFDISGTPIGRTDAGVKLKFKGESTIRRSLADRVDLQISTLSTMNMEMKPSPQVFMTAEGPSNSVINATIKKP